MPLCTASCDANERNIFLEPKHLNKDKVPSTAVHWVTLHRASYLILKCCRLVFVEQMISEGYEAEKFLRENVVQLKPTGENSYSKSWS